MNGGAIMSIGVIGSHTSSFLMDECQHSKDTLSRLGMAIGIVFLLALFPSAVAFTLASPSFETAAPLGNLFPGASLMAMRALVGVGGILGLWATVLSSLFGASRLLHRLSCDGLAPRWLRVISPHTATPWVSILICGVLSGTTAAICSSWLLLRTLGTGSLGAGVAGATAVLSRRYRPLPVRHSAETTHTNPAPSVTSTTRSDSPKEMTDLTSSHQRPYQAFDETQPRQLSVEWESGNWVTAVVEPPQLPSWNSWTTSRFLVVTFIINCLAGVGVIRGAKELQIGNWVWAGVALCACGCLVCSFGLWLQPKNPLPEPSQRDLVPALPLVAIFTNILLMLNLPVPALLFSCVVWALGCLVWVVQGRTGSLEAVLSRALLTQNDREVTPEML
ncbi:high affinity cationic amino acid transporter 1-like [Macrobrachium nipponense]|uniref:high affinity cationic amino acid transporter 1-like n=1 Tax=Macrobrachium nipponense TaxID=159736 RepID=UPI0030C7FA11